MHDKKRGFLVDNTLWYSLSIGYSHRSAAALLEAIVAFCEAHKNQIEHSSFYFSQMNGPCILFIFVLKEQEEAELFLDLVEAYFNERIGANNALAWNAFYLPAFLLDGRDAQEFAQATSLLIASLYDEELYPIENATNIATFLRVKSLKQQNRLLPEIADPSLAETIRSYWEYEEDDLLATWLQYAHVVSARVIVRCHLDHWEPDLTGLGV
jgi:hypothetical protein